MVSRSWKKNKRSAKLMNISRVWCALKSFACPSSVQTVRAYFVKIAWPTGHVLTVNAHVRIAKSRLEAYLYRIHWQTSWQVWNSGAMLISVMRNTLILTNRRTWMLITATSSLDATCKAADIKRCMWMQMRLLSTTGRSVARASFSSVKNAIPIWRMVIIVSRSYWRKRMHKPKK